MEGPGVWRFERDEPLRIVNGYNLDDAINEVLEVLDPTALELNDMLERELRFEDRTS